MLLADGLDGRVEAARLLRQQRQGALMHFTAREEPAIPIPSPLRGRHSAAARAQQGAPARGASASDRGEGVRVRTVVAEE